VTLHAKTSYHTKVFFERRCSLNDIAIYKKIVAVPILVTQSIVKIMAKKKFEESLNRLEIITNELESGNLSLEDSLKIFDEGIKLAEFCNKKLDEAHTKINLLMKKNGEILSTPFAEDANEKISE
jgi:exodeoxyribonuclease VII small subunit